MSFRFRWLLIKAVLRNIGKLKASGLDDKEQRDLIVRCHDMLEYLLRNMKEDATKEEQESVLLLTEGASPPVDVCWCCFCGEQAFGRWCFMGSNRKVVDNPACEKHKQEVYLQTHRALGAIHSERTLDRDYAVWQEWNSSDVMPLLPRDKAELIIAGGTTNNGLQ